jgi:hypothetical protein
MAACHNSACLVNNFKSTLKDRAQNRLLHLFYREADNVHCGERFTAHRVNIAQGIGSSNTSEVKGIVYDRGKKIERLNKRYLRCKAIDRRIRPFIGPDEEVRVVFRRKSAKNLF